MGRGSIGEWNSKPIPQYIHGDAAFLGSMRNHLFPFFRLGNSKVLGGFITNAKLSTFFIFFFNLKYLLNVFGI